MNAPHVMQKERKRFEIVISGAGFGTKRAPANASCPHITYRLSSRGTHTLSHCIAVFVDSKTCTPITQQHASRSDSRETMLEVTLETLGHDTLALVVMVG